MNDSKTSTIAWHQQDAHTALTQLGGSEKGLSQFEAEARMQTYGPNRLPEPPRRSLFKRFLLQFHNEIFARVGREEKMRQNLADCGGKRR